MKGECGIAVNFFPAVTLKYLRVEFRYCTQVSRCDRTNRFMERDCSYDVWRSLLVDQEPTTYGRALDANLCYCLVNLRCLH